MRKQSAESAGAEWIRVLAERQLNSYRQQPIDLISHYNHEFNVSQSYRGRQILELLQNADDAAEGHSGEKRLLVRLTESCLLVANTGEPFSARGIESLVVSDISPKQLSGRRYIGNKGLGFRCVLTWTRSPHVLSGEFCVAFSQEWAEQQTLILAEELDELRSRISEWQNERGLVPAPVMRFPSIPDEEIEPVRAARQIQKEGYDTVVVLPLPPGSRGVPVREEIGSQMASLSPEMLLFCNHLEHVQIDAEDVTRWQVLRENKGSEQIVLLQEAGGERLWRVKRERGSLPIELIDHDLRETPDFEIAVAVPEAVGASRTDHRLYVYFPTSDRLPMDMIAHATLATDDSRKRLIDHAANRHVLAQLAEMLARTAAAESALGSRYRGLQLLSGVEECDDELQQLRFLDVLTTHCESVNLFPRIDGRLVPAEEVRRPPRRSWYEAADPDVFPDLLDPAAETVAPVLLDRFNLSWYESDELGERLARRVAALPRVEAGRLVGRLISDRALQKAAVSPALVTADGRVAAVDERLFLPATGRQVDLPDWIRAGAFLDSEFGEGLREALEGATVRDIRGRLANAGYSVEEYRLESVASYLAREATAAADELNERDVWRDVLRCLFHFAADSETSEPIRASIKVVTSAGSIRPADECYLGPGYPSSRLLYELYRNLGEDEFVADPGDLGLAASADEVEPFLLRLGVAAICRPVSVARVGQWEGLDGYLDWLLSRINYPTTFFGSERMTEQQVRQELSISFDGLAMPDRWAKVLEEAEPEAIVAFLLTAGRAHLLGGRVEGAVVQATRGQQKKPRSYPAIPVPDLAHFLLRTREWVACEDGRRRSPDRIILTGTGKRALGETFSRHALDDNHPLLRDLGVSSPADMVLRQLGAVYALEALPADDLYRLLLDLPERDPEGKDAARIYRSLLEGHGVDTSSPLRERFHREGLMWGSKDGHPGYYPVSELRYTSRFSVPAPVREQVPLVAIDPRRNAQEIERVFGIGTLSEADFALRFDDQTTQAQAWSEEAASQVRRALPYLYAFRLSRTTDEASRERSALRRTDLRVCRRIGVLVSVLGERAQPVVLDRDLDGLLLRDQGLALLVCTSERMPRTQVFWRSIGDLLADAIGVAGAASDFAQLLSCESPEDRKQLLDLMTDGEAEDLLERARKRLELEDEEQIIDTLVLPRPETPEQEDAEQAGGEMEPPAPVLPTPEVGTFAPTTPPERQRRRRHRLVVSRSAKTPSAGRVKGPRCPESVALKLAEAFERYEGRYPIRVEHLRGTEGFGCDLISVATEELLRQALGEKQIRSDEILRFIEVKGRSDRTGIVALTDNERAAAVRRGRRYFLYRVYREVEGKEYELAILSSPAESEAEHIHRIYQYDMAAGSAADWYQLVLESDLDGETTGDSPRADEAAST